MSGADSSSHSTDDPAAVVAVPDTGTVSVRPCPRDTFKNARPSWATLAMPVSFPVAWEDLDRIRPADVTVTTAAGRLQGDPWRTSMPAPQRLPGDLVAEGHEIPVARVQAMHEGKRRARARRDARS